jgi:ribosome-binding factor A
MARRPERLAESLREEISEVVGFELDDPRLEAVTVTDVIVADDLRDAKVYVLVHGTDADVASAMKALNAATPFVRRQVAMNLSLKYVPLLHFARDTAEENAARVNELLGGLQTTSEENNEKDEG